MRTYCAQIVIADFSEQHIFSIKFLILGVWMATQERVIVTIEYSKECSSHYVHC
jgi:hypothetical protein